MFILSRMKFTDCWFCPPAQLGFFSGTLEKWIAHPRYRWWKVIAMMDIPARKICSSNIINMGGIGGLRSLMPYSQKLHTAALTKHQECNRMFQKATRIDCPCQRVSCGLDKTQAEHEKTLRCNNQGWHTWSEKLLLAWELSVLSVGIQQRVYRKCFCFGLCLSAYGSVHPFWEKAVLVLLPQHRREEKGEGFYN